MTTFASHILTGTHAARPAATAVPSGTVYSCTDHGLIYQSNGSAWSTWATLGGSSGITVQDENGAVASGVTQLDFQGAGISAASGSGEVVVTVGGGGSAPGAWTAYTPVLSGATTDPTLGTGSTAEGRYIENGKIVTCWFGIQFGTSGMAAGSGEIRVSLPVPMNTSGSTVPMGFGSGFNPTVSYSILRQSTSKARFWIPTTASYLASSAGGWGSAGAQIWGCVTYEAA